MQRYAIVVLVCFAFVASGRAQTTRAPFVIDNDKDFHRYALYCPKPEYPMNLRGRIGGSGKFLLHLRRDGTVESVDTLTSTGHPELDDVAKNAFIKWRFRPGPSEVRVPIQFKVPRGTPGWPFAR
jgi:TonB family protein